MLFENMSENMMSFKYIQIHQHEKQFCKCMYPNKKKMKNPHKNQ